MGNYVLILHGGCGSGKPENVEKRLSVMKKAIEYGIDYIDRGSVDVVNASVNYMEDSGQFNAGRGSCLNIEKELELDAAIMDGSRLRGAGIANCKITYNPVSLARKIMDQTDHVLISGNYLKEIAKLTGIKVNRIKPNPLALRRYDILYKRLNDSFPRNANLLKEYGTVGAVCIDNSGNPSAAVSTGGLWLKLPGRIGDSAIIGAGIYAEKGIGGACATGKGEEIIKNCLSYNACRLMKRGARYAGRKVIEILNEKSGKNTGGIILADTKLRLGYNFNADYMFVSWFKEGRTKSFLAMKD